LVFEKESRREFAIVNSPKVQFSSASDWPWDFSQPVFIQEKRLLFSDTSMRRKPSVSQRKQAYP